MEEWEPVHTIYLYFYKVFEKFLGKGGLLNCLGRLEGSEQLIATKTFKCHVLC